MIAGQQHRIGGGDGGFRRQQHRAASSSPASKPASALNTAAAPQRQPDGDDAAQQRRQAIGPDMAVVAQPSCRPWWRPAASKSPPASCSGAHGRSGYRHNCRFQHLAGRLGKAAFVPVQGRQADDPGQPQATQTSASSAIAMARQPGQRTGAGGRWQAAAPGLPLVSRHLESAHGDSPVLPMAKCGLYKARQTRREALRPARKPSMTVAISVVVPVKDEAGNVAPLAREIAAALARAGA